MILKSLVIQNYGPFAYPTKIEFDHNLTILTGQNDVGKSSVLRLLKIISDGTPINEDDVNVDHLHDATMPWDEDSDINCIATYVLAKDYQNYLSHSANAALNFSPGFEIDIQIYLAPKKLETPKVVQIRSAVGSITSHKGIVIKKMPSVLLLPIPDRKVYSVIDTKIRNINSFDEELLLLAFGENYSPRLQSLNNLSLTREVRSAAERLTNKIKAVLPASMGLEFVFDKMNAGNDNLGVKLAISLRDTNNCDTALHLRGAGVRKIIEVMMSILTTTVRANNHYLILFDEPENSLHANAQHLLRTFFEELATSERIQIIYATHSPSMINPMNPHQIRLFERLNEGNKATTIVHNQPVIDNFYPIRSSLGLSPADSLLYAPITIIVEGATEVLGLPILLKRLYDERVEGFDAVGKLLAFSHLLDGNGSSFEYWCRVAKSQGCKPIIFVDGDKEREIKQQQIATKHPDVPIILLDQCEFEEIVPKEIYFSALRESVKIDEISLEAFSKWEETRNLPNRMAFSKRVDMWLGDVHPNVIYYKWDVMKKAIERANLTEINIKPFEKLVKSMGDALSG